MCHDLGVDVGVFIVEVGDRGVKGCVLVGDEGSGYLERWSYVLERLCTISPMSTLLHVYIGIKWLPSTQ